jgi:hypothetical protein
MSTMSPTTTRSSTVVVVTVVTVVVRVLELLVGLRVRLWLWT